MVYKSMNGVIRTKMTFAVEITKEGLETVIEKMISGSMHWCFQMRLYDGKQDCSFAEHLMQGGEIEVFNGIRGLWGTVNLGLLLEGLEKCAQETASDAFLDFKDRELYVDADRVTEKTADEMLQQALFGCIRYVGGIEIGG